METIGNVVDEVRRKLQAGQMAGVRYRVIFRAVGSTRAVVEIMGAKFTIDDSTRLVKQAKMVPVEGRGASQLGRGKTQRDVTAYLNSFPQLGPSDFALRVRESACITDSLSDYAAFTDKSFTWADLKGENRRFMFDGRRMLMGIKGGTPSRSSHATEWSTTTGSNDGFDDAVRGWVGIGGRAKHGVIHFAPPITGASFSRGFDCLLWFKKHGAGDKCVVRGFPGKWEQSMSDIVSGPHPSVDTHKGVVQRIDAALESTLIVEPNPSPYKWDTYQAIGHGKGGVIWSMTRDGEVSKHVAKDAREKHASKKVRASGVSPAGPGGNAAWSGRYDPSTKRLTMYSVMPDGEPFTKFHLGRLAKAFPDAIYLTPFVVTGGFGSGVLSESGPHPSVDTHKGVVQRIDAALESLKPVAATPFVPRKIAT